MVEAGMPIDIYDWDDENALMKAADNNQTDVVRYLLNNGANVNKQNSSGDTALHFAFCSNSTDAMRILLQHGARKDIKNDRGYKPMDPERFDLSDEY